MTGRPVLLVLAGLLCASAALNVWLLWSREPASPVERTGVAASPLVARPEAGSAEAAAASFTTLVSSVGAARRASAVAAPADQPTGDRPGRTAGAADGRVTRALLDDLQCQLARSKAAEAWRKEADGIRAALLRDQPPDAELRALSLAGKRAGLADVLGVDESDARVAPLAEQLQALSEEAEAEVRRQVALDPPDWRAAFDVVRGLYRQQDAAVARTFDPSGADDWRLNEVENRAVILAIGASLVGVPWSSVDDRTPPSAP